MTPNENETREEGDNSVLHASYSYLHQFCPSRVVGIGPTPLDSHLINEYTELAESCVTATFLVRGQLSSEHMVHIMK
jgi:hypothetical protein